MNSSEIIATTIRPEVQAMRAYPVTPPWTGIKIELMEDNHLDTPQSVGIGLRGSGPRQEGPVVGDHAPARRARSVVDHLVGRALFEPRHEEDLPGLQRREPREVDVAPVEHEDRGRRKPLLARHRDFVPLAGRDHERRRQIPVVVEREVQLHRALRAPKRGPRKQLGAQIDDGRVEAEQLVLEAELLRARHGTAAGQQLVEDLLVQWPGMVRIRERQRGAAP